MRLVEWIRARLTGPRAQWSIPTLAAVVLLCLRLPFLPPSLEDLDSVNFDLGVHDYNPPAHQPHPPGYPVYILLAKLVHPLLASHAAGLGLLSAVTGALAVFPLYLLMRQLTSPTGAVLACLLTLFNPFLWFNSVRPMSDLTGFLFTLTSQSVLLRALLDGEEDDRQGRARWYLGALLAGLAVGVRLQVVLLVVPLVVYGCIRLRRVWLLTLVFFGLGVLLWLVPLVYLSGGPVALASSFTQLVRDAAPVEPLLSGPTPRRAVICAINVLVTPWHEPFLAGAVLALAVAGGVLLLLTDRQSLARALLLFLPYGCYHYFVQSTETIRYAIPTIPLVALLAAVVLARLGPRFVPLGITAAVAVAVVSAGVTVPALSAYHSTPSPPMQALDRVRQQASSEAIVASGHHMFVRYLAMLPKEIEVLVPPSRSEWKALMGYWRGGGRDPILFLRQPHRTSLLLVARDAQTPIGRWSWPPAVVPFMQGERPSHVELVRLEPPRWFCESGFLTSLEAGPTEVVAREPHQLYLRPRSARKTLTVSGHTLSGGPAEILLRMDGRVERQWTVDGNFTVRTLLGPLQRRDRFVPASLEASAPVVLTDVWCEPVEHKVIRPADGFYFPERDEGTKLFRWMAPRARAAVYVAKGPSRLTISGWIPLKYYRLPVRLTLTWNGVPLMSFLVQTEQFRIETDLEAPSEGPWGDLTLAASQSFVPDDRVKNGDRRVLAIRVYDMRFEGID